MGTRYVINGRETAWFNNDGTNESKLKRMRVDDLFELAKRTGVPLKAFLVNALSKRKL